MFCGAATSDSAPAAVLRRRLYGGYLVFCAFLAAVFAAMGDIGLFAAAVALAVVTWLAYFIILGFVGRSYVARRVGRFVMGFKPGDWFLLLIGLALAAGMVYVFHLVVPCIFGVVFAVVALLTMDRVVATERRKPIEQAEQLLKDQRRQGTDDRTLRRMVCEHGGAVWEPFFEELFGYESKLAARQQWGYDELGRPRPADRPWRDAVVRWMEERPSEPSAAPVAAAEPVKEGEAPPTAIAAPSAEKLPMPSGISEVSPAQPAESPAPIQAVPTEAAQKGEPPPPDKPTPSYDEQAMERDRARRRREEGLFGTSPRGPIAWLLGPRLRFLVASGLIAGCLVWMHQNDLVEAEHLAKVRQSQNLEEAKTVGGEAAQQADTRGKDIQPLKCDGLSPSITQWFNSYGPGVAGLILIFSTLFRGVKISLFMYPAAAVAMFGDAMGDPSIGSVAPEYTSIAAGGALAVVCVLFGRVRA